MSGIKERYARGLALKANLRLLKGEVLMDMSKLAKILKEEYGVIKDANQLNWIRRGYREDKQKEYLTTDKVLDMLEEPVNELLIKNNVVPVEWRGNFKL